MRFEIVIMLITIFVIANIYAEGKYITLLLSWKKYYQMFGVAFVGYMFCWLFRKNPERAKTMIVASNEYLKYLPVDKDTSSFISPILDFTSKYDFSRGGNNNTMNNNINMVQGGSSEKRIMNSGKQSTKRSVSETKKKFVAAKQNWHCGNCKKQLPAWFEVDHTVRLEHGGSNHVDNLVALCRDCHGEKTAMENL
jgi:5-methylcytosine-specific restriction endonuclease McrA